MSSLKSTSIVLTPLQVKETLMLYILNSGVVCVCVCILHARTHMVSDKTCAAFMFPNFVGQMFKFEYHLDDVAPIHFQFFLIGH